jgi:hypothetical protein
MRWLYQIGLFPIFGNKGYGLTWPGPLHRRIGRKIGRIFILIGKALGAY